MGIKEFKVDFMDRERAPRLPSKWWNAWSPQPSIISSWSLRHLQATRFDSAPTPTPSTTRVFLVWKSAAGRPMICRSMMSPSHTSDGRTGDFTPGSDEKRNPSNWKSTPNRFRWEPDASQLPATSYRTVQLGVLADTPTT